MGGRTGGIAFDAPEHGELVERSRSLDARPFFLGGVRVAARGHLERHGRLEKDRADVRSFLDKSGQLLHDRDRLDETAPEDRALAGLPLAWEDWKRDADALLADAEALRRDIPDRELAAHLAAASAEPDAIDDNAAKIENRIAADEEARAEAERRRLAEERVLAAQEAERLRLEEEREKEQSEGGGISMS